MKVCGNCNNANDDQAQYCGFCGSPLPATAAAQPVQGYDASQLSQAYGAQVAVAQPLVPQQDFSNPALANSPQSVAQSHGQQAPIDYSQPAPSAYGQPYAQNYYQQATPNYAQPQVQGLAQQASANYAQAAPNPFSNSYAAPKIAASQKSKTVAGVLALFLGNLGAQRFYLGNTKAGIINLILFLLIIPIPVLSIISLIEGIKFLTMSQDRFEQEYVINHKPWF